MDLSYLPFKLKQEQLDALDFCYKRDAAIMSLGTGVGKTITSCVLIKQLLLDYKDSIAIFIIPSRAIKAFEKEMKRCYLEYDLWESSGKKESSNTKILLVTHTSLVKYQKELQELLKDKICFGVVDEIHNFSVNYETAKPTPNKGTKVLISLRPFFKRFYALTATTVKNNVMSLYTMCNIVKPNYFGSPRTFQNKYCTTYNQYLKIKGKYGKTFTKQITKVTGLKKSKELEDKKNALIIFRQLEYNIETNEINIPLDIGLWNRYRYIGSGAYNKNVKLSQLAEFNIRLIELQRVMDNTSEYFESYLLSNKEQALINLIKKLLKEGHIPIIYCFYLETINRVKKILEDSNLDIDEIFIISGKVPKKERALVEDKITKNTVTIINRAGTESINLQKADTMIFYNISWSVDEYLQCIGRITRNDTEFDKQLIYFLEYEGTLDNYKVFNIKSMTNTVEQFQGEQLVTSDGISLTEKDRTKLRKILLWCTEQEYPITKDELLKMIHKS